MLTSEQQGFIDFVNAMPSGARAVLDCPAGFGKTFTISRIPRQLILLAPTHKAAGLYQKNGIKCQTVARFLKAEADINEENGELFFRYSPEDSNNVLVIVDECSMIKKEEFELLTKLKGPVVFVGDQCQLPPVKESISLAFTIDNKFSFTRNMRLLSNRDSKSASWLNEFRQAVYDLGRKVAVDRQDTAFMLNEFSRPDVVMLCWTNRRVHICNELIRRHLYGNDVGLYTLGESVIFSGYRWCSLGLIYYSGDVITIKELKKIDIDLQFRGCDCNKNENKISPCNLHNVAGHSKKSLKCSVYHIKDQNNVEWCRPADDVSENNIKKIASSWHKLCLQKKCKNEWSKYYEFMNKYLPELKYRYAMTTHMAQGSEFDTVFISIDDIRLNRNNGERARILYTAISRMRRVAYFI